MLSDDETRVLLNADDSTSDYINASYIRASTTIYLSYIRQLYIDR